MQREYIIKYKVYNEGWVLFDKQEEAEEYAEKLRKKTGNILGVIKYKEEKGCS